MSDTSKVTIGEFKGVLDLQNYRYPFKAEMYGLDFKTGYRHNTVYGYTTKVTALFCAAGEFILKPNMWFVVPGACQIAGEGIAITRYDHLALFKIGGPIEDRGRLRYIDTCSDTLLASPDRCGDPCLNHLHFPKKINQTMHTHPSIRVGIIAKGRGECHTPDGKFDLFPGMIWYLPEESEHCFHTFDSTMDVIAWHPETDFGPKDEDHPMINRTLVGGESAAKLESIRTKGEIIA